MAGDAYVKYFRLYEIGCFKKYLDNSIFIKKKCIDGKVIDTFFLMKTNLVL